MPMDPLPDTDALVARLTHELRTPLAANAMSADGHTEFEVKRPRRSGSSSTQGGDASC